VHGSVPFSRVTKSQGEGAIWGVFIPTDNALYSIHLGYIRKTAEPIEMPFGIMSGLGSRNSVIWGLRSRKGKGQFWENVPDKPNALNYCELDWSMQRHMTSADA